MPISQVNMSGNWGAKPGGGERPPGGYYTYFNKVQNLLGANLVWYMGLDDANGSACAVNRVSGLGNACYAGAVVGGQDGIGDGRQATLFHDDGATSKRVDITTAYFQSAFSGSEGAIGGWMKVFGASTWTGGTVRQNMHIQVDASNEIGMSISANPSAMRFIWTGAACQLLIQPTVATLVGWVPIGMSWSKQLLGGSGQVLAYFNGASLAPAMAPMGVWAGLPIDGNPGTYIGDKNKTRGGPVDATLYGFWMANRAVTSAEMATLGTWP